jgi:hypothetical protein
MVEEFGGDGRRDPSQGGDGPPDSCNLRHGRKQAKGAGRRPRVNARLCSCSAQLGGSSSLWRQF